MLMSAVISGGTREVIAEAGLAIELVLLGSGETMSLVQGNRYHHLDFEFVNSRCLSSHFRKPPLPFGI